MRSGKLLSKNDDYIEAIIEDKHYDIRPDGTIWTLIQKTGKLSVKGEWREAGRTSEDEYREISYLGEVRLRIHRIVYRKYVGELSPDLVINHKDGNKSNNRPENLELISQAENNKHKYRELGAAPVIGRSKIDEATADAIRADRAAGANYKTLMSKYGLAKSSISYIVNNKTWNRHSV